MSTEPPSIRRLCLKVDVEAYSRRTTRQAQLDVQNRVLWVMAQACRVAKINPARCDEQYAGDGQLLILPGAVDEGVVLPGLALGLLAGIARINDPAGPGGRIRLRVALGQGDVQRSAMGFVGPAVVAISRLLDSDELKAALSAAHGGDVAFAVTTDLYDDVFSQGAGGLPASGFRKVQVNIAANGFVADTWIQVPDRETPPTSFPQYSETRWLRRNQRSRNGDAVLLATAAGVAWAAFAGRQGEGSGTHGGADSGQDSADGDSVAQDPADHGLGDQGQDAAVNTGDVGDPTVNTADVGDVGGADDGGAFASDTYASDTYGSYTYGSGAYGSDVTGGVDGGGGLDSLGSVDLDDGGDLSGGLAFGTF